MEESPCRRKPLTRRSLLQSAAIGTTALAATAFAKPFIHSAFSAGTLDVGLWDHWVPGGNEPWKKLAEEWGDKNHVDVNLDFITSQGDKLNITIAAEAQAGSGHDIMRFGDTQPGAYSEELEPVDEIATALINNSEPSCRDRNTAVFMTGTGPRCRYRRARSRCRAAAVSIC